MTAIDQISADLDWRESELGSLKILLMSPSVTPIQRKALLRAAWAMLYAHYEGFCKACLTFFYDEARARVASCGSLPAATRAFALEKAFNKLRALPALELESAISTFDADVLAAPPEFPEVNTKANLWPNLLEELLEEADLDSRIVTGSSHKLATLVTRRNQIAHGEQNFVNELDYYLSYERCVYALMYDLAFMIDERLQKPPYHGN